MKQKRYRKNSTVGKGNRVTYQRPPSFFDYVFFSMWSLCGKLVLANYIKDTVSKHSMNHSEVILTVWPWSRWNSHLQINLLVLLLQYSCSTAVDLVPGFTGAVLNYLVLSVLVQLYVHTAVYYSCIRTHSCTIPCVLPYMVNIVQLYSSEYTKFSTAK